MTDMIQSLSHLPHGFLCNGHSLSVSDNLIYLSTLSIISLFGSLLSWKPACILCRTGAALSPLHLFSSAYFISHLSGIPTLQALTVSTWSSVLFSHSRTWRGEKVLPVLDPVSDREAPVSSSASPLFINLSRWLGRKGQNNNWGLNSPCPARKGPETVCLLSLCQTFF